MLRLTENDNGAKFPVSPGETIEVRLIAHPGTGYEWQVRQHGSLLVEEQVIPRLAGKLPGSSENEHVFQIKAKAQAIANPELQIWYVRPFQPDKPLKVFSVTFSGMPRGTYD
jgi:predicted secreted protein